MQQLMAYAAMLGVQVRTARMTDEPTLLGYYSQQRNLIVVRRGLTRSQGRRVLAHELGHAYHQHLCSGDFSEDNAREHQAESFAARLLIDPERYAIVEAENPDQHVIADILGVSVDLVLFYERHHLTRLRGVTYTRPRLGLRQWAHKAVPA